MRVLFPLAALLASTVAVPALGAPLPIPTDHDSHHLERRFGFSLGELSPFKKIVLGLGGAVGGYFLAKKAGLFGSHTPEVDTDPNDAYVQLTPPPGGFPPTAQDPGSQYPASGGSMQQPQPQYPAQSAYGPPQSGRMAASAAKRSWTPVNDLE